MDFNKNFNRVKIGDIYLDASIREGHKLSGKITSHPVETGIDVTDNYRVDPRAISISGIITNTPLEPLPGSTDRVADTWATLQSYFDNSEVINIVTSLKVYESMVLTSLSVTRDAKSSQVLNFTADAKELRFVSTEYTRAVRVKKVKKPKPSKPTKGDQTAETPAAQEPANKGNRPVKPANTTQKKTAAKKMGDLRFNPRATFVPD